VLSKQSSYGSILPAFPFVEKRHNAAAYEDWKNGILLKRIFKTKFSHLYKEAEFSKGELEEARRRYDDARLSTQIEISQEIVPTFGRVCDTFAALSESQRIWDTISCQTQMAGFLLYRVSRQSFAKRNEC
jgi:hypothetical protein